MNRIKEILDEKGIKQTWLASKLVKSYNMVNSSVTNKRQTSVYVFYKIAEFLDVKAKYILKEEYEALQEP